MHTQWRILAGLFLCVVAVACGGGAPAGEEGDGLSGSIRIDGSSTVFPISEAVAEEFQRANPNVRVTVGISGTGGGFERFCGSGDTDISNASRPIEDEEAQLCEDNGIEYTEVDIEATPGAADFVMSVNGGNQTVPTVHFPNGTALTNPTLAQVKDQLAA